MNYLLKQKQAPRIKLETALVVPAHYQGKTNFIIPDRIVAFCIEHYDLINDKKRILDPMCGLGTIPRVINAQGGNCMGIEIDPARFEASLELVDKNQIILGDFLTLELMNHAYSCIFTSMPFDWFKNPQRTPPATYAEKFKRILSPEGFILLDSVPHHVEEEQTYPIAQRQSDYLENHGFTLHDIITFYDDAHPQSMCESVIMMFKP